MSDKRTSATPIIVGAVIALLGILVGFYIAVNAREQLEAASSNLPQQEETSATENAEAPSQSLNGQEGAPLPELPAVEETNGTVDVDVNDNENVNDDDNNDVNDDDDVDVAPVTSAEDDFVPVSPEEIEQALPPAQ